MKRKTVLVVGLGEVGCPLFELLKESGKFNIYGYDIDEKKLGSIQGARSLGNVDVMHICYPCTDQEEFAKVATDHIKRFEPKLTIINSTVPPRTTKKIHELTGSLIVHSPIRGMHRNMNTMKRDLLFWTKYIGGVNTDSAELARRHFKELGLKVKVLRGSVETELAKLFNTTYRALMIAWFQEMHRISKRFDADFDQVINFLEDTHRVRLDRPIFFPNVIGGHCLIPNANLLLKSYNSEFVGVVLKSNKKRKEEIKDSAMLRDIEKIRKRAEVLQAEL